MVDKVYYDWNDLNGMVLEVARQVNQDNFRPDYIVGITRGGVIPATMLSHFLGVKMYTLDVRLRDGDDMGPETNCWMSEDAFGYQMDEPHRILIVDDINDSGATFNWIKDNWQSSCLPQETERWANVWHKTVRFAALTTNMASPFAVDYSAHEVNKAEKDCWLVYPWEEFWNGSRR